MLPDRGRIGDRRAHVARRLRLERLQLLLRKSLAREGDESHAHSPHVVLLRGTVELHCQHVRMEVGELREERFLMDALLIDEPEVGVVQNHHDLLALRGRGLDRRDDLRRVRKGRRVAGGVVREVEDQNLLLAGPQQRLLHRHRIKLVGRAPRARRFRKRVERLQFRADGLTEDERVVVPVEIGHDHLVPLVRKQLCTDAQAMREGVRHHGIREGLAPERRILPHHEIAPARPKRRQTEAAGVKERLAAQVDVLGKAVHDQRRAVLLERHADGGVDFAGLRFRTLPQNSTVGEVQTPPFSGEKSRRLTERFVQSFRQYVHRQRIIPYFAYEMALFQRSFFERLSEGSVPKVPAYGSTDTVPEATAAMARRISR